MTSRVLVTGATGFIGSGVVNRLIDRGQFSVTATVRPDSLAFPAGVKVVETGGLAANEDWSAALAGQDYVIHLAARVHVMRERASDPLAQFRQVNVEATLNLARQAAECGIPRFIFMSSVKVNGESGSFTEDDPPAPEDAYAVSKNEAELGLRALAVETGMQVVIIRAPLVYGPGVKGNIQRLQRAIGKGIPLPLGAIRNRRSLVGRDNLVDIVIKCMDHSAAGNETFFVSDGEDLSTTELVLRLARAMNRSVRLVPIPPLLLIAGATIVGMGSEARRLVGSLQVDISKAKRVLDWIPPFAIEECLGVGAPGDK